MFPGTVQRTQHADARHTCLALFWATWHPSSIRQVRFSIVLFILIFFVRFPGSYLVSTDVPCPDPLQCSDFIKIKSATFVFLLPRFLFLSLGMLCLTYFFPSLMIVRLLDCSLPGWWVPCFHIICHSWKYACVVKFSLRKFQSYPRWCRVNLQMFSSRAWFFFKSSCLGFCLCCCIAVQ